MFGDRRRDIEPVRMEELKRILEPGRWWGGRVERGSWAQKEVSEHMELETGLICG